MRVTKRKANQIKSTATTFPSKTSTDPDGLNHKNDIGQKNGNPINLRHGIFCLERFDHNLIHLKIVYARKPARRAPGNET